MFTHRNTDIAGARESENKHLTSPGFSWTGAQPPDVLPAPFPAWTGAGAVCNVLHGWSPWGQGFYPEKHGQHGRRRNRACPELLVTRSSLNTSLTAFSFFAGQLFVCGD